MHGPTKQSPKSWLAFDLNVLRRMKFSSAALPFCDRPELGTYLKRMNVRIAANDPLQSAWSRSVGRIANGRERLSADDVNVVLEDAYVPGYRYKNAALTQWFNETDAWWFDNVRAGIDKLDSPVVRAIAASITFAVGDYVLSFNDETRELRQPLSNVFRRIWTTDSEPFENGESNTCSNKNADDFIAETRADLMFLRLPVAHAQSIKMYLGRTAWREEWLRGGDDFWTSVEGAYSGRLGGPTETKSQYLHHLEETLRRASHIPNWAIAHVESGFIGTQDIVDTVAAIRRVDTVYTKDFSELTGTKAVIITA
ncbi:MAG TPA: hypothetical protein VGO43_06245 [Pyrinomonadaceae bacterium]|jgi:hypothetical protein|nr:hypothetical protein [Pyrinomonadaceae bacterium]